MCTNDDLKLLKTDVMVCNINSDLPEQYHGNSTASDSRCDPALRMLQWMALYCRGLILSAANRRVNIGLQKNA